MTEINRKFRNNQIVIAGSMKLKMIVIDAELCLKGWRYHLGFLNKDGSHNKKMSHRFFFEEYLSDYTGRSEPLNEKK